MKSSAIQSSVILKAIRERRPWKEIMSITDIVCITKDISNEKNKQKKVLQPDGTSFAGIENLKSWTDQTDKYLIYITRSKLMRNMFLKPPNKNFYWQMIWTLVRVTI